MKKIITIIAAILFVSTIGQSQVPDNLKEKFRTGHPDATLVNWSTLDEGVYKVTYTENNARHSIVYNKNMMTVWTRTEIPVIDYPAPVTTYFKTNYPNEKDYKLYRITEDGKTFYYTPLADKKIIYLDKEGKMIRMVNETTAYPKPITDYYVKKYPDQKYIVYSVDENGNVTYYTMYKGKIYYFDKEGNFIREGYHYEYDNQIP